MPSAKLPMNESGRIIFTAWLAVTLVFFALRILPGDAIETQLRATATSPQDIARRRAALGLDQPILIQYGRYLADLGHGDLGDSLISRESVNQMIAARLIPTFSLAITALMLAIGFGLLLGMIAVLDDLYTDHRAAPTLIALLRGISTGITTLALATPAYWTATLIIFAISTRLKWLPSGGNQSMISLILPALVLGFHTSGAIARITETSLRQTLHQPFIQTARAKGLPPLIVFEHALRVGILPVFNVIALQAGFLLSGTVLIEVIFTRRGLGSLLYQAVLDQDYPVVQGLVLVSAIVYAATRLAADLCLTLADPRLMGKR